MPSDPPRQSFQSSEEQYEEPHDESSIPSSKHSHDPESQQDFSGLQLEKKPSKASVNNVASIPNGGLAAWLQVAGAFALFFNSWSVADVSPTTIHSYLHSSS